MTDLPDPGTDPIPEVEYRYPLLARLFGIDVAARQIADAFMAGSEDAAALADALATLRAADHTVDNIEK